MPYHTSKKKVYVTHDTFKEHGDFLKEVFNKAGLWVEPVYSAFIDLYANATICVFSEFEMTEFSKKGHAGWVGKDFNEHNLRVVVFPELTENVDGDQFQLAMDTLLSVDTSDLDINLISTKKQLVEAIRWLQDQPVVCVDFETKHLDPYQKGAKLLSVAFGNHEMAYVMPLDHDKSPFYGKHAEQDLLLGELASGRPVIAHNLKYEYRWFKNIGFTIQEVAFDPMLVHHLLDETAPHSLDYLSNVYTKYGGYKYAFERGLSKKDDYESADYDKLLWYNGCDVIITSIVAEALNKDLARSENVNIKTLWHTLIKPLIPVIAEMENQGLRVDINKLAELTKWYADETHRCEQTIKTYKPLIRFFKEHDKFNFESYPQMRVLLYDQLDFNVIRRTKPSKSAPRGNPAVDDIALKMMKNSKKHTVVIEALMRRSKTSTIGGMLEMYRKKLDVTSDDKLRTNFNMHVVETGRLSSTKPPLQNIPTTESLIDVKMPPVKEIFTSRFEDGNIVHIDFGQIELRTATMYTIANGTPDKTFIKAFMKGVDLHGEMAQRVYGDGYTKEQRNKAKRTNFSAVFGISAKELATKLETNEQEAQELITSFRSLHPELYEMFNGWWKKAQKKGYIRNFLGRTRHIADSLAKAEDRWERDAIERQVWNFPIQSTAAEMTFSAMLDVQKALKKHEAESVIICNTHDAQDMDTPADETEIAVNLVKYVFTNLDRKYDWITVPIAIDVSYGKDMFHMNHVKDN